MPFSFPNLFFQIQFSSGRKELKTVAQKDKKPKKKNINDMDKRKHIIFF